MNLGELLEWLRRPPDPKEGWYSQPAEYMVREENADLEPNGLDAVKRETGVFWLNFADMICGAIQIYLRASGLRSIREDFKRVCEHCDRLEDRLRLMALREGNLFHSSAVSAGEVVRLEGQLRRARRRITELEAISDSLVKQ